MVRAAVAESFTGDLNTLLISDFSNTSILSLHHLQRAQGTCSPRGHTQAPIENASFAMPPPPPGPVPYTQL